MSTTIQAACGRRLRSLLVGAGLLVSAPVLADFSPQWNYLLHCSGCHLENGAGGLADIPDLRTDAARLVQHPEGRHYLVRVPGAMQAPLSDNELAALMNWIIGTLSLEAVDFTPYSAEEIASLRSKPLTDPLRERGRLMAQLEASEDLQP